MRNGELAPPEMLQCSGLDNWIMYHTYNELMEKYSMVMASLGMPYATEEQRIAGTLELTRLQDEMELELVAIMVVVTG